ncbi:hypothetical protein [Amycolatopsis pittospori]|uniref:hypothetical protein n=1 Tax=Amycolatopsis pittospori TaxID=2749434 RepID=UPI0015F01F70|nr:hypothetical protein [Amycolatopsis pittospori]
MSTRFSRLVRGKGLWLSALFVVGFVGVDFVLWWLSGRVAPADRAAFIGAASAWGVASVGLGAGLLSANRAGHHAQITALQNERRAVYARLVLICERFDGCRESYEDAEAHLAQNPDDPADARAKIGVFKELFAEFRSASATASLVASSKVDTELKRLLAVFQNPEDEPMKPARAAFLEAVREELLLARKPGL